MTLPDASDTGHAVNLRMDGVLSALIKVGIIHCQLNEHGCHF